MAQLRTERCSRQKPSLMLFFQEEHQNFPANSRAALSRSWSSTSSLRVAQAGRGKLMRTGAGM